MKDIYVRGIFVVFGGGISSALVGIWEMLLQLFQSFEAEITAPPQLLEIVLRSLGDAA